MKFPGRILLLVVGLVLVGSVGDADAAAKRKKPGTKNKETAVDSASDPLTAPLVSSAVLTKLRITTAQRPKVSALFKEFNSKLTVAAAKAREEQAKKAAAPPIKGKKGKGIKVKGQKGTKGMKGRNKGEDGSELQEVLALREEYEDKFGELLTDAQKKMWEDIKIKQGEALLTGK